MQQKHQQITWESPASTPTSAQEGGRGWDVEHTILTLLQHHCFRAMQTHRCFFIHSEEYGADSQTLCPLVDLSGLSKSLSDGPSPYHALYSHVKSFYW